MSLTIKAATAMHFAGAAYAAGDTIDTTGMDDRSIAVLLKHQPVYVASAASGVSVKQGFYQASGTAVSDFFLPWSSWYGDALFDLTDPILPTALADGLYLVAGSVRYDDATGPTTAPWTAYLQLDLDNNDGEVWSSGPSGVTQTDQWAAPLSMSLFIPAGSSIALAVSHAESGPRHFASKWDIVFIPAALAT